MKKIKLLTPILGLTAVAGGLVPLASCSKQQETEKVIPDDAFSIKDVTLKGFKDDFDYKNYTKLVVPSNVKVIDTNAFKGLFTGEAKVTTIVIPGNVETIKSGAFANNTNVTVYDFSSWTVDQIHVLEAEAGSFDLETNGIYSFVKMGDNWTDVQKDLLKQKLMTAGIPAYCFVKQTNGNVELNPSSAKEQQANGGEATNEFNISKHYSSSLKYKAVLTTIEASEGVDVEHDATVTPSTDYKKIAVNAKMKTLGTHKFVNGDYVTYKITLICYTESTSANNETTYNAQWSETIETFKLTYHNVLTNVTYVTDSLTKSNYYSDETFDASGLKVNVQFSDGTSETIAYPHEGLYTSWDNHTFTASDILENFDTGKVFYKYEDITLSDTFPIKMNYSFVGIKCDEAASKLEWTVGETFDKKAISMYIGVAIPGASEVHWDVLDDFDVSSDISLTEAFTKQQIGKHKVNISWSGYGFTKTTSIEINISESKLSDFASCTWAEIGKWCTDLENGTIDTTAFYGHFSSSGKALTKMDDFIGLTKDITINNKKHTVRVIDTQHDKDLIVENGTVTNKKAALTFELVNLLSDSNGNAMKSKFHGHTMETDKSYIDSVLRHNISGQGDSSYYASDWWKDGQGNYTNALEMLPTDLKAVLKVVQKETEDWVHSSIYQDKLFPLTRKEMVDPEQYEEEGSAYKFWELNDKKQEPERTENKIKSDINNKAEDYWLATHYDDCGDTYSYIITTSGDCERVGASDLKAVSFAFCI